MSIHDGPFADGTPCWVDLSTSDPDSARAFYSELFGWVWSDPREELGNYSNASLDGKLVAGLNGMAVSDHPPVWATYLATGDAAATQDAAVRHGANLVAPTMDVADLGKMAILQDAHRGTFGIWEAGQHTGTERVNETGALIWNEYMTRDYDEAKEFFAAVFSYTYTELGEGGFQYSTVEVSGNTVGGLGVLDDSVPAQMPPHFRVYFAVDNCDDAVDHLVKLGGSVLKPPADMPYGRHADVADPQGAQFCVIKPVSPE